ANRGHSHYSRITKNEGLEIAIKSLKKYQPNRSYFYTSGRSSNEAGFLIQLLARQFGTNNVNNCSYYCHQASGVGLKQTLGTGTATVTLNDVAKADLVVLIGANPSSNHPRFITHLAELKKRGGKVIIINPFREAGLINYKIPSKPMSTLFGSKIADEYLQPHLGGDMALFKVACKYLIEEKKVSTDFLKQYTNGVEEFLDDIKRCDLTELLLFSGINMQELITFCDYLVDSKRTIFSWAMGLTHQKHGVDTIRTLVNLALLLGKIGQYGAGLLPLRGHSNVQGIGSMGVVPKLPPEMIKSLAKFLNLKVPNSVGLDTFACMKALHDGQIDFGLMLGGNLYGSNPNSNWAAKALSKLDQAIYISTTLNKGHLYGMGAATLILPVRVRDEEMQTTTQESMFSYVRLSEGGFPAPANDLQSESEIFCTIGEAIFGNDTIPWSELTDHQNIRKFIAKTVPNYHQIEKISLAGGDFTIPGRIYHKPKFSTENGKANLFIGRPTDARPMKGYYNLTSFRSEGQFNTIIYDEEDEFRGTSHRRVVFMNPRNAISANLKHGDTVIISSDVGEMTLQLIERDIREGNVAMYFPEANEIIPAIIDPQSRTPAFKKVKVSIRKLS
ncbi:MAG: FdhF/YdeP family oxidoreductase, partial [Candidatus Heimdallarchaeota archaeon]|nr:FdhF/YdeP family oxidoreductase [Candidatus Heimdallarchaeota archaeon]